MFAPHSLLVHYPGSDPRSPCRHATGPWVVSLAARHAPLTCPALMPLAGQSVAAYRLVSITKWNASANIAYLQVRLRRVGTKQRCGGCSGDPCCRLLQA